MFNEIDVPGLLVNELPEIKDEIENLSPASNIFKTIQCLANYTMRKVMQHDLRTVKKCFIIADNIYSQGDVAVRNAIENIFVYSFSSLMNMGTKIEKRQLHALVPMYLYTAYVQQLQKSGI